MFDELVERFLAEVNNFCLKLIILHYIDTTDDRDSNMAAAATVTLDNMNPCIKKMEYAVRGPL